MTHTLKSRLVRAEQSLHDWHEQLSRAWLEAEEVLAGMGLGRSVAVHLHDEDATQAPAGCDRPGEADFAEPTAWSHYLALTRLEGRWRICYVRVPVGCAWQDRAGTRRPIGQCRREVRVRAAEHLPRLLRAAVEEAERIGSEVEAAVGLLREAITPFKGRS